MGFRADERGALGRKYLGTAHKREPGHTKGDPPQYNKQVFSKEEKIYEIKFENIMLLNVVVLISLMGAVEERKELFAVVFNLQEHSYTVSCQILIRPHATATWFI